MRIEHPVQSRNVIEREHVHQHIFSADGKGGNKLLNIG
jgi:hypothetical protein